MEGKGSDMEKKAEKWYVASELPLLVVAVHMSGNELLQFIHARLMPRVEAIHIMVQLVP